MARYEFCSVFSGEIKKYIKERVSNGIKETSGRDSLVQFDKFCNNRCLDKPVFLREDALAWTAQKDTERPSTHYRRVNDVKHFLEYAKNNGYDVYVPRDVRHKNSGFIPHIYTDDEVQRYFMAVDTCSRPISKRAALQYPVLFRILYCCGTRISETLGIKKKMLTLKKGSSD